MKIVTKMVSRVTYDKNGKAIKIYRKEVFKPGHPDYEKELALEKQWLENQNSSGMTVLSPNKKPNAVVDPMLNSVLDKAVSL